MSFCDICDENPGIDRDRKNSYLLYYQLENTTAVASPHQFKSANFSAPFIARSEMKSGKYSLARIWGPKRSKNDYSDYLPIANNLVDSYLIVDQKQKLIVFRYRGQNGFIEEFAHMEKQMNPDYIQFNPFPTGARTSE